MKDECLSLSDHLVPDSVAHRKYKSRWSNSKQGIGEMGGDEGGFGGLWVS